MESNRLGEPRSNANCHHNEITMNKSIKFQNRQKNGIKNGSLFLLHPPFPLSSIPPQLISPFNSTFSRPIVTLIRHKTSMAEHDLSFLWNCLWTWSYFRTFWIITTCNYRSLWRVKPLLHQVTPQVEAGFDKRVYCLQKVNYLANKSFEGRHQLWPTCSVKSKCNDHAIIQKLFQGGHTPIKSKFPWFLCVFNIFPVFFFSPAWKYTIYFTTLPTDVTTNIH